MTDMGINPHIPGAGDPNTRVQFLEERLKSVIGAHNALNDLVEEITKTMAEQGKEIEDLEGRVQELETNVNYLENRGSEPY
jgi:predicted  nucleic acid-binding Zn-ribbon protein